MYYLEGIFFVILIAFLFFVIPIFITIREMMALRKLKTSYILDVAVVVLGTIYSYLWMSFIRNVQFDKSWNDALVNNLIHSPISIDSWWIFGLLCGIGILGYVVLSITDVKKTPPLVTVLSMSALFVGTLEVLLWAIQVFPDVMLLLVPLNVFLIVIRIVRIKIIQYEPKDSDSKLEQFLSNSKRWPLYAFVLMWPLLAIIVGILILLGQRPDAAIRTFTETSDWNLSLHEAPENVVIESDHYLCTVAANGHTSVVKPIRKGVRRNQEIIVNRQLCIANAFEQVIEEKTPTFHKHIRHFYDTYGFPIAKLIRSKGMADAVYYLMKPLEYIFLFVLYMVDVNPENRIAMQYTNRRVEDIVKKSGDN